MWIWRLSKNSFSLKYRRSHFRNGASSLALLEISTSWRFDVQLAIGKDYRKVRDREFNAYKFICSHFIDTALCCSGIQTILSEKFMDQLPICGTNFSLVQLIWTFREQFAADLGVKLNGDGRGSKDYNPQWSMEMKLFTIHHSSWALFETFESYLYSFPFYKFISFI